MIKVLLGGTAAATVLAFAPAMAQPAPPPPPGVSQGTAVAPMAAPRIHTEVMRMPMMPETRDAVVAHVREMFSKMDANHDGFVTREEADSGHREMAGKMHAIFTKKFAEGDFPKPDRGAMFDKLDANHDGVISRQEYMAAKPDIRERHMVVMRHGKGPVEVAANDAPGGPPNVIILRDGAAPTELGDHPGAKVMRLHGPGMGMGMHGKMFEMADANHDGKVSMDEMTGAALKHFDSADANHDGKLSPDERMQMHREVIEKVMKMKPA
jgi:Ca2+-binding EF-hand superfamily protein